MERRKPILEKLPKGIAWLPGLHIIDGKTGRLSTSCQSLLVVIFLAV
jgi:hypothetical protein